MLTSLALGAVIGLTGGMWLVLTIISVHSAIVKNRTNFVSRAAPLLGFPTFIGGGTWAVGKLVPIALIENNIAFYFLAVTLIILIINAFPCYKLVLWCAKHIDEVNQ